MGGLARARLERGHTVCFEIFLPRVEAVAAGSSAPVMDEPAVVLIEPNPEMRRILHVHFEEYGFNLLEAASCEEAFVLAELYEGPIPLVIANPGDADQARTQGRGALRGDRSGHPRAADGWLRRIHRAVPRNR